MFCSTIGKPHSVKTFLNIFVHFRLFYESLIGDHIFQEDDLDIPSKDIEDYLFVLEPLAEIAGELLHPVSKTPFSELLKQLKSG